MSESGTKERRREVLIVWTSLEQATVRVWPLDDRRVGSEPSGGSSAKNVPRVRRGQSRVRGSPLASQAERGHASPVLRSCVSQGCLAQCVAHELQRVADVRGVVCCTGQRRCSLVRAHCESGCPLRFLSVPALSFEACGYGIDPRGEHIRSCRTDLVQDERYFSCRDTDRTAIPKRRGLHFLDECSVERHRGIGDAGRVVDDGGQDLGGAPTDLRDGCEGELLLAVGEMVIHRPGRGIRLDQEVLHRSRTVSPLSQGGRHRFDESRPGIHDHPTVIRTFIPIVC